LQCDVFSEYRGIGSVGGTPCHIGASRYDFSLAYEASAVVGQNMLPGNSVRATPAVTAKRAVLAAAICSEERNGFHRKSRFRVDLL
jgi:hypothetical protein